MRRLRLAALLWLATGIVCLASPVPPGFQISGLVVSTRDGSPVPYCRLTAFAIPGSEIGTAPAAARAIAQPGRQGGGRAGGPGRPQPIQNPETRADASGHFTLSVPHAGGWRLTAEARGFNQQDFDTQDGFFAAVVLSDAEPAYKLTFKLTPEAILTGLVYDEAGEPVEQAQVRAELLPTPVPGASKATERPRPVGYGQTDDRGHYEISGLAPGKYLVKVEAHPWYSTGNRGFFPQQQGNSTASLDPPLDFVYASTWFPGTDDENSAEPLALSPGEERQADLHLTAIPSVHLKVPRVEPPVEQAPNQRGRVQNQQPPQILRVTADGVGGFNGMSSSGNSGEWDFGGLSPGTYEVHLPGSDGRPDGEVRQVTVTPGSQSVMTLEAAKPLIRVEVALDGVPDGENVGVEFVDTETGRRIQANIPQRGRRGGGLILSNIPPMVPRDDQGEDDGAAASKTRYAMLPAHEYEVYLNGNAADYLTGLAAPDAKIQGRTITVGQPTTLTVHVANGRARVEGVARMEGKPLEGAMVLLVPATLGQPGNLAAVQRDETNTDGTFLISGVIPGQYILVAIDHGWTVDWRKPETLAPYLLHGVPIEVKPSAKVMEELDAVGR